MNCRFLELPRSGSKQQLFERVAGVLAAHDNGWGKVKKKSAYTSARHHPLSSGVKALPTPKPAPAPAMPEDEAAELAAMIQASIDSVDVDELTEVLDEPDDPPPLEYEGSYRA